MTGKRRLRWTPELQVPGLPPHACALPFPHEHWSDTTRDIVLNRPDLTGCVVVLRNPDPDA